MDNIMKIKNVLVEMRDAREIYERCRSGGADCDCIDVFHALKIYANLIEKSYDDSIKDTVDTIKLIKENSIRKITKTYPQITDDGIVGVCEKALRRLNENC